MSDPTLCAACDHVEPTSRRQPTRWWLCMRHHRLPGFNGFVTGVMWEKDPPFLWCRDVNGGACPLFEPRRVAPAAVEEPSDA